MTSVGLLGQSEYVFFISRMLHQSFKVFDVDFGLKKLLDIEKGLEINNIVMDTIDP